jgi:hypothetical protein
MLGFFQVKNNLLERYFSQYPQAPLPSQSNLHPLGQGMMLNEK